MKILYFIKENPNSGFGHAAQRARAFIKNWEETKDVQVFFLCPGTENKSIRYSKTHGFSFIHNTSSLTKMFRVFHPYHFRLIQENISDVILSELKKQKFDIIVSEELPCGRLALKLANKLGIPCTMVAHNFEYDLYSQVHPFPEKIMSKMILKSGEKRVMQNMDIVFAFSELDKSRLKSAYKLENLKSTRAGTNVDDFRSIRFSSKRQIAFVGALDYYPNIEGLRWFSKNVYKKITTECHVSVIGKNPAPEVKLICESRGFQLVDSPSDIRPYLSESRIEIVPLRMGSGTRGKILEAAAARIPVVSTTLGAEGLPFKNKHDILIADSSNDFASNIELLLNDSSTCNKITDNAFQTVQKHDYKNVVADLTACLIKIFGGDKSNSPQTVNAIRLA